MAENEKKENKKQSFKAWMVAIIGAIIGAICSFFLCRHKSSSNLQDIRGGFKETREQLDGASNSIQGSREDTAQLDDSARECEQRVNECQEILRRVREQGKQ